MACKFNANIHGKVLFAFLHHMLQACNKQNTYGP